MKTEEEEPCCQVVDGPRSSCDLPTSELTNIHRRQL